MRETISCPRCGRHLRASDALLGKSVQCPGCGNTFTAEPGRADSSSGSSEPRGTPRGNRDLDEEAGTLSIPAGALDLEDARRPGGPSRSRGPVQPHRGSLILFLGIGGLFCCGLLLGPAAWFLGNQDLEEMRLGNMDLAGEPLTQMGRWCGIAATVAHALLSCCAGPALLYWCLDRITSP